MSDTATITHATARATRGEMRLFFFAFLVTGATERERERAPALAMSVFLSDSATTTCHTATTTWGERALFWHEIFNVIE